MRKKPKENDRDDAEEKEAKKADAKPRPAVPWNKDLELLINFEINRPASAEKGRYRRPYVAVWVEDRTAMRCARCRFGSHGRGRAVPVAPRFEAMVPGRPGAQANEKKEIFFTVSRPTRAARQVQGHLGRQGQ